MVVVKTPFFLEVVVVLILLIELYYAFRGKGM
jgi:hypothetical protein